MCKGIGEYRAITLTTGADTFTGTAGNDVINGYIDATASAPQTLTAADAIAGGAGSDTLNVTVSGTAAALPAANITGIETINVRAAAALNSSDLSTIAGVTAFNSDRSTAAVTVTNLAAGASAGVIGDGTVTNGAFNAGYVSTATSSTLNISGGTKAGAVTLSGTGLTSATVNSTGAANTIGALALAATQTSLTIDAAAKLTTGAVTNTGGGALTTLTVKGAGAVNLSTTALETSVTKIDASANSGGLTVKLSDKTTISVTGSSGADVITTNAVLTTGSVNAGDGIDTLDLGTNVAHANTAALAAKYTNFETLRVNGTFDASLVSGITAIEIADANANSAISKLTATQAAAVTVRNTNANDLTLALAVDTGTTDVVSLTMGAGTTTAAATNLGALTINGVETLNVKTNAGPTSTTGAAKTTTIGSFVADKLTAINLSGNAVTLTSGATTKAVTIDASALTGDGAADPVGLTIGGNVVTGSTVIGSAVADTMTLGTGFATYNGGAGKDTFNATAAQLNTGANYNTIDGGDGTDTLNITGGAALTLVDNNLRKVSNVEKIVVATTVDNNQSITTGGWFDGAFKTSGVDLTTTTAKGTVTIDMTSFSGAAKLTVTTVGTGATEGAISVQTGSGADTITVSAAAAGGAGTVKTFDGDDKITTASTEAFDLTGGKGNDTLVLGSTGIETINFESTAANNGVDTITGFEFGTGKDVLQFKGFVGAAEAETLGGTIAGSVDASAKNVLTLTDIQDLTASNFGGTASTTVIKTAASQKLVVIADKAADLDAIQNIYYVTTDASNVATVTLVGTINEGTFHTDNIITA